MIFRAIVTGSRDWPDPEQVITDLWALLKLPSVQVLTVVWGRHWQGTDEAVSAFCAQAESLAVFLGKDLIPEPHPAAWNRYGARAGPLRNTEMVELGAHAYLSYRLNGELSKGTTDCLSKLRAAGIYPLIERELSTLPA